MAEVAGRGGHLLSRRGFVHGNCDVFKDLRENQPRLSHLQNGVILSPAGPGFLITDVVSTGVSGVP